MSPCLVPATAERGCSKTPPTPTPGFSFIHFYSESTDQSAQQVHSLQHQLLVADPGHAQFLQVLVCDLKQLLATDFLPFKVADVLLQAVVQTLGDKKNK